jgi:orotidine-5'-phosphate decarboxylase
MTFLEKLQSIVGCSKPGLCVGLDPDPNRLPRLYRPDLSGISDFLQEVIRQSAPFASAYKVNTAFYEALGSKGWRLLEEIAEALPPNSIRIADAKRGDIGNTAERYAEAFLHRLPFDAVTINPYLGGDSLQPFLKNPDKGGYVLALTTNPGSKDLQYFSDGNERLYQRVLKLVSAWAPHGNLGAVVGATYPEELLEIRAAFPALPLLIPGVGAQGGDLQTIAKMPYSRRHGSVLVNVSRAILYAENNRQFPDNIRIACEQFVAAFQADSDPVRRESSDSMR